MTHAELSLLKTSIDQVVELEIAGGERYLARILFVFDEGETPDVFYLKVSPGPDGELVAPESNGHSLLLSEIVSVHPYQA